METRKYRTLMTKRRIYSEGSFGEAKVLCGMDEAHLRGLENMSTQSLMTSMVQNIKKYIKYAKKPKAMDSKLAKSAEHIVCLLAKLYKTVKCHQITALKWV